MISIVLDLGAPAIDAQGNSAAQISSILALVRAETLDTCC